VKQHAGVDADQVAAACLFDTSVNDGSVAAATCATPPSSSSSPPSPLSPANRLSYDNRPTTSRPPEVGTAPEMTSSSSSAAASVGSWPAWRTERGVDAPAYPSWSAYGLPSSAGGVGVNVHGGRVWPSQPSADEHWVPMSGFDRRYGGSLVAQPWYHNSAR